MVDQIAITRTVRVAAGVFAPGHLGELTQFIPFEMVDEVLAVTRRTQQRIRLLPARVVVYLVLAGCLFTELGYGQVWQKLTAGLGGLVFALFPPVYGQFLPGTLTTATWAMLFAAYALALERVGEPRQVTFADVLQVVVVRLRRRHR